MLRQHPKSTLFPYTTLFRSLGSHRRRSPTRLESEGLGTHFDARLGRQRKERSEEHTSELQSRGHLVCRLLLEKKKPNKRNNKLCAIHMNKVMGHRMDLGLSN